MDDDFLLRSSLDNQIKEAKSRAELFSKSLHDARAQEAIALRILEEERERWAHSFEEKSIMIEQLERELTFTVEALDVERSTDKMQVPKFADLKVFSNEEVEQTFHELMEEVNSDLPAFRRSIEGAGTLRTDFGERTSGSLPARSTHSNTAPVDRHAQSPMESRAIPTNQQNGRHLQDVSYHSNGVPDRQADSFEGRNSDGYRYTADADKYIHRQQGRSEHNHQQQRHQQSHSQLHNDGHHAQHYHPSHALSTNTSHTTHSTHPVHHNHHNQHNQPPPSYHLHHAEDPPTAVPQRSVSPPRAEPPRPDDSAIWRDLLTQYQEQLKLAKGEAAAAAEDREKLAKQVTRLEQQLKKVTEERELFATASENAEGKLKFRVAQVLEYEQDKDAQSKRVAELSALNSDLQSQLHALRHELLVANTELRVHASRDKDNQAVDRYSWVKSFEQRPARSVLSLDVGTLTDPVSSSAGADSGARGMWEQPVSSELSPSARQQIQAAEAHAQDLHRQVTEAHSSYTIQLEEAKKVASSLQMLLKDTERRGDEFRTRCHFAEQAATQYKAERDALLTMVSKLHLTPQADAMISAPAPPSTLVPPQIASVSVHAPHDSVAHAAQVERRAPPMVTNIPALSDSSSADVPSASSGHPSLSSSHDQVINLPRPAEHSVPAPDVAPRGIAVVPFLSRSEDFAVRQGLPVPTASVLSSFIEEKPATLVEDADSSLEVCSDEDGEMLRPESATGSVLDMAGRLQSQSLESVGHWPVGTATEASAPPQFVSHAGRVRGVSLQGMLAASNDTALSRKPSSGRRLRSASGAEGQSIQKSKSKSKSPTAAAGSAKKADSTRLPAPAVGQPGKSMVIRKPPSYTGASNEIVRGSASPVEVKANSKASPAVSRKVAKKSPGLKPVPKASKVVATPRATPEAANQPTPVPEIKDFVPPSYSNRNDVSWESEVSRADTSGLSHDVDDFADADAHFEQHAATDDDGEMRSSLDAAGLTVNYLPQHVSHAPQPSSRHHHRYYEGDEFFEGEDDEDSSESESESEGEGDKDHVLQDAREVPQPRPLSASAEKDLLDHTIEFTRMQNSLGQRAYAVHDLHGENVSPAAQSALRASKEASEGPRVRSNSLNSASVASVATANTDRSSRRGSSTAKQPKYLGITDIKISRKSKAGDTPVQTRASATKVPVAPGSSGQRALRTPSPMTRGSGAVGAGKVSSAKRVASTPRTRLPTTAVVTPIASDSRVRVINTGSSVLKRNPKDKLVPGGASRQRSLMY